MTKQEFLNKYDIKVEYTKTLTGDEALAAVKQNGWALQSVKDQTEAIALAAVKQEGYVLQYVKDQTEKVALAAMEGDLHHAKEYVNLDVFEDGPIELTVEEVVGILGRFFQQKS